MEESLIKAAILAAQNSYSPYSNFTVGSALLAENGKIYLGCNIENGAYTPSNCAERTAFFKAISEGVTKFKAIAIVGGHDKNFDDFCSPCGVCRHVMSDFCSKDFEIILGKKDLSYKKYTLEELLPHSFELED